MMSAGRIVDRRPDTGDEHPRTEFRVRSIASSNSGANGYVEVRTELVGDQRDDRQMESAVSRLSLEPSVTSIRWASDDLPETKPADI